MKHLMQLIILLAATAVTLGCSTNYYNIPRTAYEEKVHVLGVAPIFVDAESDIRYPEKDALVNMLKNLNRENERELEAELKDTGEYFIVQLLPDDPDQLFSQLYSRRERRDDAGIVYNKYFFKGPELKEYMRVNKLDALMVVVISGVTKHGRRYSSNYLSYLDADYNNLIMTAEILDADNDVLWEYPNFHQHRLSFPAFFELQYPDFDEAGANESDKVEVHLKTIPGIAKAFSKTKTSGFRSNTRVSTIYADAFDDIVSFLQPQKSLFKAEEPQKSPEAAVTDQAPAAVTEKPEAKKEAATQVETKPAEQPEQETAEPEKAEPIKADTIKTEDLSH